MNDLMVRILIAPIDTTDPDMLMPLRFIEGCMKGDTGMIELAEEAMLTGFIVAFNRAFNRAHNR
jgi:hypothetical protein